MTVADQGEPALLRCLHRQTCGHGRGRQQPPTPALAALCTISEAMRPVVMMNAPSTGSLSSSNWPTMVSIALCLPMSERKMRIWCGVHSEEFVAGPWSAGTAQTWAWSSWAMRITS